MFKACEWYSGSYVYISPGFHPSAPCPPEVIEKSVWCDNHTASISWSAIPGAVNYTATLEQINGNTTCCTTSDTSCHISDLPCGEMFILLVTAEGRSCNSSQSAADIIRTGMIYIIHIHSYFNKCGNTFWFSNTSLSSPLQHRAFPRTSLPIWAAVTMWPPHPGAMARYWDNFSVWPPSVLMATRMSALPAKLGATWQVCSADGTTQLQCWQNTVTARAKPATALKSKLVSVVTNSTF